MIIYLSSVYIIVFITVDVGAESGERSDSATGEEIRATSEALSRYDSNIHCHDWALHSITSLHSVNAQARICDLYMQIN